MRIVKGGFVTSDKSFSFSMKCGMGIFFFWIVVSIVTVIFQNTLFYFCYMKCQYCIFLLIVKHDQSFKLYLCQYYIDIKTFNVYVNKHSYIQKYLHSSLKC